MKKLCSVSDLFKKTSDVRTKMTTFEFSDDCTRMKTWMPANSLLNYPDFLFLRRYRTSTDFVRTKGSVER